tara:strand:- start:1642 stop:2748 length:1107 start_codon:yes stop_codon:yes gene_type:complete
MTTSKKMMMAAAGAGGGGTSVWGWGRGDLGGTLDNNATVNRSSPIQMTDKNFSFFFAGGFTTLAIDSSDALWIWGRNNWGQIGDGSQINRSSPVQIAGEYIGGANNSTSSLIIKTDGTMWAMGRNQIGQLGQGNTTDVSSPVQVGSDTDWATVIISNASTVAAIKTGGELYTCGSATNGLLGNGTSSPNLSAFAQVGSLTNWKTIRTNSKSFYALKTDDTLWTWGDGASGGLAQGSTTDYSSPVQIAGSWIEVDGINEGAIGIKTGGTLYTWGENNAGQLGDGSTTDRLIPVQIGSNTDWVKVAGNGNDTAGAVTSGGTLFTWGSASQGMLANGTVSPNLSSPVQVGSATDWLDISGFSQHFAASRTA